MNSIYIFIITVCGNQQILKIFFLKMGSTNIIPYYAKSLTPQFEQEILLALL